MAWLQLPPADWVGEDTEPALPEGSSSEAEPEGPEVLKPCCQYACVACSELRAKAKAFRALLSKKSPAEIYEMLKKMRASEDGVVA